MQLLYPRCAGLDVHKKTVVACRIYTPPQGEPQQETRTFGTMTADLLELLDWLLEWGCTHVVMESTGEYWRPVYNLLEGHLEVWLVNARHVQNVPGRKTDVGDAEWLADLLRHGLLSPSFVPPRPQRELRALTRHRANLVGERAMVVNWLQKVLEDANIKLAAVATDVTGKSARAMLEALIAGQRSPGQMAELARGRMRQKREALEAALTGFVEAHHRFLLIQHLTHLDFLEEQIEVFNRQIDRQLTAMSEAGSEPSEPAVPSPTADPSYRQGTVSPKERVAGPPPSYTEAVQLLDPIPGIDQRVAQAILAEVGTDMRRFASAGHLCSWAGVAPGNRESGGKRYSGRTTPGNAALRKALVQAAHGAVRTRNCYFGALYHRLAGRRGKKRAIVAVARSLLVVIYHVLLYREAYRELGANYFDERRREAVVHQLLRRLEKLGFQVSGTLQPVGTAAAA